MKKTFFTIAVALLAFAGTASAQLAGTYKGALNLTFTAPPFEPQQIADQSIELISTGENVYTLKIYDFKFGEASLGDIAVENVAADAGGNLSVAPTGINVPLDEETIIPVTITLNSGKVEGDVLTLSLNIQDNVAGGMAANVSITYSGIKTAAGIFSASAEALTVSPTLVSDVISVPAQNGAAYVIYNQAGAAVAAGSISGSSVNVSSLAAGVYVLSIDGKTAKFVKK